MRTPETHYFEHGFIKFFKEKPFVYYTVYFYWEMGFDLYSVHTGRIKDEAQIKQLQSVKNQNDVKLLVLGTVK